MSTPAPAPKKRIRAADRDYQFTDFDSWKAAVTMLRNRDDIVFADDGDSITFAFEPSKQNALPDEEVTGDKVGFFNKQREWGYVDAVKS
jgi:hypothetical protein